MTSPPRQRFSVRIGLAEDMDLAPYDGVPTHLEMPLQSWVASHFPRGIRETEARAICSALRIPVSHKLSFANALTLSRGAQLLDVVDYLLGYVSYDVSLVDEGAAEELSELLDLGGSAYRLNAKEDGLEVRITPPVREAVVGAIEEANAASEVGSASKHLATAWQLAYGLHPNPVEAYSCAIKAVEAAAHHVIQTNHPKATLGTMIGEIHGVAHKFTSAISGSPKSDPIAMVEAMMRTLWEGQTSRHGGKTPTIPETLDAARAGVHLAAALVQWFTSGAVSRS